MTDPALPAKLLEDKTNLCERSSACETPGFSSFDKTLTEVRSTFADLAPGAAEALFAEAVATIRKDKAPEAGLSQAESREPAKIGAP
jgi:hypothetical protein